ncbi:MAG: helix-turn-helix domain-containing protein [Planctomycetes bacterium]|nr:helix-turn-helix domain-containing protein [Planctomycetota bacterium]
MSTVTEYRTLLTRYTPRPIRSARDYRRMVALLEELMTPHPDEARSLLIEMLATLIEKYEAREQAAPASDPAAMLAHLLAARQVRPAQVASATGIPPATISNVLAGRRGISKQNAVKLGGYFRVSPLVFLTLTGSGDRPVKKPAKQSSAQN